LSTYLVTFVVAMSHNQCEHILPVAGTRRRRILRLISPSLTLHSLHYLSITPQFRRHFLVYTSTKTSMRWIRQPPFCYCSLCCSYSAVIFAVAIFWHRFVCQQQHIRHIINDIIYDTRLYYNTAMKHIQLIILLIYTVSTINR